MNVGNIDSSLKSVGVMDLLCNEGVDIVCYCSGSGKLKMLSLQVTKETVLIFPHISGLIFLSLGMQVFFP